MQTPYQPEIIEPKWQAFWEKNSTFRQYDREEKFYVLDMFPYPSGAGLHVGHPKGYIATDVLARMKQIQGKAVLHPMGWDAFGLPAEQYAIKNKIHPRVAVEENIATFKGQLAKIGFTYDWEREINTTDPEYYRWTQWIFLKLWEAGLAYESHEPINWCPSCKTGLANEDLEQGKCERCGSEVEKRPLRQWVLAMTQYADRLLYDLDSTELQWSPSIKEQQRNWIGRSEGAEVVFPVIDTEEEVRVFTTRVDTLFGCAYVVVAPEHPIIQNVKFKIKNWPEIETYQQEAKKKSDLERTELNKEKTGVLVEGLEVAHPFTGIRLPVYVADYVLASYGTGAVMGVPAHDERDYEFAKKYNADIKIVIEPVTGVPQDNEEHRKSIVALVEDPESGKVLSINWGKLGGNLFIGGGLEGDEDPLATALREIQEETGYKNVELISQSEVVHHHYFAVSKNVMRNIDARGFYFRLIDNEKIDQKLEEDEAGKFSVEWLTKEEASRKVEDPLHKYLFAKFVQRKIYTEDGVLVDSGEFSGLTSAEARERMTAQLESEGLGQKKINYKMRDWTFSRQRYWGEPIPLVHCADCGVVAVPENELPVMLPEVESYEPNDSGESPLANIVEWVNVPCPKCGKAAKRETNTMPQWAGSCWYYLRYIDAKNTKVLVDPAKEKKMMPVDVYVGGTEHATRHLLYARFWHKFLYDQGVVSTTEPFMRLVNQGLILASDGRKMSKRWGNVINPDEMVGEFGADAFRLYEMFMGPFTQSIAWNTDGLMGTRRFLEKVWRLQEKVSPEVKENQQITNILQTTIKKVSEDVEDFKFNTAISSLMILVNTLEKEASVTREAFETLLVLLAPFAPHMTEELWHNQGHTESIFLTTWPEFRPEKIVEGEVTLAVQVNGRVRGQIALAKDTEEAVVRECALQDEKVKQYLEGKEIKKVIVVANKIVSIVVS